MNGKVCKLYARTSAILSPVDNRLRGTEFWMESMIEVDSSSIQWNLHHIITKNQPWNSSGRFARLFLWEEKPSSLFFYEDSLDSFADIILGELFHGKMDDWYMCVLGHKSQHSIKCEIFTRFPCYICIFCINAQKSMAEFGWLISWNE